MLGASTSLTFQYPMWYLALCPLLGLGYALLLYYRDRSFDAASGNQQTWVKAMSIFRFVTATGIAALLLSPLMKKQFTESQDPYILVVEDDSQSMKQNWTASDSVAYHSQLEQLVTDLGEKNKIERLRFSSSLETGKANFEQKVTNISQALSELNDRYSHQNVGAVILASDGIYNEGSNPIYNSFDLEAPVYTIAMGDTTEYKDLRIDRILHNRIAYQGDQFTVRVDYSAVNSKGKSAVITLLDANGAKLGTRSLKLKEERSFGSEEFILDADNSGLQSYRARISVLEGELNTGNNSQRFYVDVLEGRQKIVILANNPHPDLGAIQRAVDQSRNYESEIVLAKDYKSVADADLVLLHGLPSRKNPMTSLLESSLRKKTPLCYILTSTSDLAAVNANQNVVEISGIGAGFNDSRAIGVSDFNLFTLAPSRFQELEQLPPLQSPYGKYAANPTAQVLLRQEVSQIKTDYPLLAFEQSADHKIAVLAGEGLWRWAIHDYRRDQNFETTQELISKIVQYLSVKKDKRQFRVEVAKSLFNENEAVSFTAELYNDSYELVNDPEATLVVADQEGKQFPFTFNKSSNAYLLDAGILPVGSYSFTGKCNYSGNALRASGQFTVSALELETMQRTANHQLLFALSNQHNGQLVYPQEIGSLKELIQSSDAIAPVLYSSFKTQSIINLKWLFFLLVLLLSIEWFVRKYAGGY